MRYYREFAGTITYVEVKENGLAEVLWQKETNRADNHIHLEVGKKPLEKKPCYHFNFWYDAREHAQVYKVESNGEYVKVKDYDATKKTITSIEGEERIDRMK